jgi:hypothetical protein
MEMLTTMAEDSASRKRLKKKFLDRWENEGGRLCDEQTRSKGRSTPRKQESEDSRISSRQSTNESDNPTDKKRRLLSYK